MNSPLARLVGDRVAARRGRAGLTSADLARAADVTPAYISQIEAGRRLPSIEVLGRLAAALGCLVADFTDDAADLATRCSNHGGDA